MRKNNLLITLITILTIFIASITTAFWEDTNSSDDAFDAFEVPVTAEDTSNWEQEMQTSMNVVVWKDSNANAGTLEFNLDWNSQITKAKIVLKLPEQITTSTDKIKIWTVFDQINTEETSLNWNILTVSLFSTNPVISNGKAFSIDFEIKENTERAMYNFEVDTVSTSFTDSDNNTILASPNTYSAELAYTMPAETTKKEEGFAEVSLIILFIILSVYLYSQRRRTV